MKASQEHCQYCFDTILSCFRDTELPAPGFENLECPIFVTWKRGELLRGCTGTFSALPLHQGLRQYALASAFKDSRFTAITADEVESLTCSLSILHQFEPIKDFNDWKIGMHGLRMRYKSYHSTYLPQVAREQGWNHLETVRSLLKKAGFSGDINDHVLGELELTRFQVYLINKSSFVSCTFDEYAALGQK